MQWNNTIILLLCTFHILKLYGYLLYVIFPFSCFQARLSEIITSSGTKSAHSSGLPEKPWMIDGAGVHPDASQLLPELVNCELNCDTSGC